MLVIKMIPITAVWCGGKAIKAMWCGSDQIFPSLEPEEPDDSYWVDTNGIKHYFNAQNTPGANFAVPTIVPASYVINGYTVLTADMREIYFKGNYGELPASNLLRMGTALEVISLEGFTSMPYQTNNLTYFLRYARAMKVLNIGSLNFSRYISDGYAFQNVPVNGVIKADTLEIGNALLNNPDTGLRRLKSYGWTVQVNE